MRRRVLHKIKENIPNTFIGGIAKTGGTGVNEPIDTSLKLATKLGISQTRIRSFNVVGDNVECNISGSYALTAFGALATGNANKNITSYIDVDGLVTVLPQYTFRYCSNFSQFLFSSNITSIGDGAFSYTAIVNADLSYLSSSVIGDWYGQLFRNCALLTTVNTGDLGATYTGSVNMFRGCTSLENIAVKQKYYAEQFRGAGAINAEFYNEYVLELRRLAFAMPRFSKVEVPNCTLFTNEVFYQTSGTRYLKQIIAPKVTSIGINTANSQVFRGQNNLELVDIRACKTFLRPSDITGDFNFRDSCKAGTIVKVHIFMATSNAGNPDVELPYIKDTRGGVVEFYDDNGDYVSTL